MPTTSDEQFHATQISASTVIKADSGVMGGIFISSASSTPTIAIYDGTSVSGVKLVDTFTPVSATPYPFPFEFSKGLFISISGTVSATVFWV